MYAFTIVATLVASALAAPSTFGFPGFGASTSYYFPCLTDQSAASIVNQYATLLIAPGGPNFNKTANALLSDQFQVYSDSINSLSGRPLGTPSYPSKQAFLLGQAQTPPLPVINTQEIFHTCNQLVWRWNATGVGSNQNEILGLMTMNIDVQHQQINRVNSEFNSLGFSGNIGYPECQHAA